MAVTARKLRRLEAWSNWRAAGGTRQAVIDDAENVNVSSTIEDERLIVKLPIDSPAAGSLGARRVIAIDQEDTRQNLAIRSQEFDSASWLKSGGGAGGVAPVVTANQALAPDGTLTADKIVWTAAGAGDQSTIAQDPAVTFPKRYTGSFYIKAFAAGDIGKTVLFRQVGGATYGTVVLTAAWQRVWTYETSFNALGNISIGLRPGTQGSSTGTVSAFLWGYQLEPSNRVTDYIPTLGAAVTVGAIFDEYKIIDRTVDHQSANLVLTAQPFRVTDLAGAGLIARKDSDGVIVYDFEVLGLTPTEILNNWIIPALAAAGYTWITVGTITPTARLDMTFAWDTPLAALLRLASATQSEVDIRQTTTGYAIDLVTQVNALAQMADIRVDKNLVNVTKSESSIDQATRVFPRGGDMGDGMRATMARAKWAVQSTAGPVITLKDPAGGKGPIQFDGQLVGTYFREPDGTMRQVTASSASGQTVTLASTPITLTINDLVEFRADAAGADLVYLENPVAVLAANYGIKAAVRDVPDVPATNNIVKNAAMRTWPGGAGSLPTNWTAVGTPTIAKQVAAPFTAIGGQSIKVTSTADGQGVISDAVPIFPTATNPYLSGYAKLWVASGNARVELVINTPTGTKIFPLAPDVAAPTSAGQWFDVGAAGFDANAVAATSAQIRIVQNGVTGSVFYVDAAQITQSATQQPWFEGSGGTRLWQEANEALRTGSNPLVSYAVPLADLEQFDPVTWSDSALILGATAHIVDGQLGIDVITRIVGIERDYINPQNTSVTLSNRFDDLTDLLAGGTRAGRVSPSTPEATGPEPSASVDRPIAIVDFDAAGHPQIDLIGQGPTASMKIEVSSSGAPTDAAIEATTPIGGSASLISYSSPLIPPGGTLYLGAYSYSGAGGTGTRSQRLDVTARRQGAGAATPPQVFIGVQAETQTSITHRITGVLGAGGVGTLQYRYRYDTNGVTGTWSSYAALGSFIDLVRAKNKFYTQELVVQVRDGSTPQVESYPAYATILGQFEPIDTVGGRILHGVPMDAGFTPFQYGSDTAVGVVETAGQSFTNGNMLDASRRVVNVYRSATVESSDNLFKRGSNTATDVVTTTSRTFVDPNTATQVDSSGRIVGVYRLGVIEPVNNLVKFGDALGATTIASLTISGPLMPLAILGSPTNNLGIQMGSSSVFGVHGAMFLSGYQFISYNAWPNTSGVDSWTQSLGSNPSGLFEVRPDGFVWYGAVAGKAVGNKATFWTSRYSMINGNVSLYPTPTSAGTASTYGLFFALTGSESTARMTLGVDGSYGYIQSWSNQPLYLNSQGNQVYIGESLQFPANYHHGLVGKYDPAKYRMVYAIGDPYRMPVGGTTLSGTGPGGSSFFGIFSAYDDPAYKNISGHSLGHGMGIAANGAATAFIANGIWTSGSIYAGGNMTGTDFILSSDLRLKRDLEKIGGALDKLDTLIGYTFRFRDDERRRAGLIAQHVRKVLPEAVHQGADGYLSLSYDSVIPLVIEAVKELREKVRALE
jgi:hypothetical protein